MCVIAPHPDLQEKLRARLDSMLGAPEGAAADAAPKGRKGAAKKAAKGAAKSDSKLDEMIGCLLRMRGVSKPGLDDGLIIPGSYFPLGTPVSMVRSAAADRAPLTGTVRVVVILVNFKDKKMTAAHNKSYFQNLFFSTGVLPHGSVKEYYKEATHGIINIDGEVAGPFTLSQNMSYYAHGASGMGGASPNARNMAQEAAQLANPSVNFAPYDNDGNGFVDAFIVLHAGSGAEQTGSVNDIWSHKWVLPAEFTADGTKIYGYLTVPEDSRIGVCAHELGHLLFGFPDLYDTDYSSEGIGNWCLMSGGSWNGSGIAGAQAGDIPAHPSAWCKANQGWVSTVVQTANADVTVQDVKTSNKVYRLWKDGTGGKEYFLVENRQRVKYDQGLPGDGLLIWHIDDSISSNTNEAHPKVKLVQADGLNQMEAGINRGNAGDPYPGSTNNRSFTDTTTPNSKSYAGVKTCVSVTNISNSAATMTAHFNVKCAIIKNQIKDLIADKTIVIDKSLVKEIEGKGLIKEVDKPTTDKTAGFDKQTDKFGDKLNEGGLGGGLGGLGGGGGHASGTNPQTGQPFIGANLRPDLSRGALLSESDANNLQSEMETGSASAKRLFDSKLPEV